MGLQLCNNLKSHTVNQKITLSTKSTFRALNNYTLLKRILMPLNTSKRRPVQNIRVRTDLSDFTGNEFLFSITIFENFLKNCTKWAKWIVNIYERGKGGGNDGKRSYWTYTNPMIGITKRLSINNGTYCLQHYFNYW